MEAAPDWILSTINGKIASVSLDYGIFAEIAKKAILPIRRMLDISAKLGL